MKNIIYILFCLFICISCIDDAEYLEKDELGAVTKSFIVDAQTGSISFQIYSNKPGTVSVMNDASWLHVATPTFEGDATIKVEHLYNDGLPRMGQILLETATRRDTVHIKQHGLEQEKFNFSQTSVVVYNGMGDTVIPVECSMDTDEIDIDLEYADGSGWITSVDLQHDKLILSTVDNPSESLRRIAYLRFSYTDTWEQIHSVLIRITQTPSTNALGEDMSFEELRNFASATGSNPITEDWSLTAYVVSRPESRNMGQQDVLAVHYIDYESEDKTAYIQSEDGQYGFRVHFTSADDNVFIPGTRIRLMIEGATICKETSPLRYTLENVTADMLIESVEVAEGTIPVKSKHITDLRDSDIYTYVTITDCEIPVRKGSLTPVNEGYTYLYNNDKISKFPILIRDIKGGSMYMYTNMTCPYRRDGRKLPYGKGSISGIIVHEKYLSFIDKDHPDETLCGNIGNYQIRHTRYEDIALEDDFENSFSGLITEYRYLNNYNSDTNTWYPTYGTNGSFTHTDGANVHPLTEFSYLGPCGKEHTGNVNGFGVTLPDGSDIGDEFPNANSDGKGSSAYNMNMCWRTNRWWASKTNRPEAWVINFSTKNIESDHVSMQLSVHNRSQELRDPRYWVAEWSLQGDTSEAADAQWHQISEYVVPDVGIDSNTLMNQSLGFKQMDFPLPLEILNQDKVYIRLRPTSQAAGSGLDYDESTLQEKGNGSAISYFAIRYNKQN